MWVKLIVICWFLMTLLRGVFLRVLWVVLRLYSPPLRNQHFAIPSSMIDEEPHLYRYTNTKSVNLIDNQKSIKNIVKILFEERKEWKFLIEIYISRVTAGTIAPITSSGVLIFDWLRNNWHIHKHCWWSFGDRSFSSGGMIPECVRF